MSAIVVLLVSKLQNLYITEVKSTSLLSTKAPKTQTCRFYHGKTDMFDECNSSTTSKQTSIFAFSHGRIDILLTSKPPKTQKIIEHEATGVILKPCRAICGYLRPSASVLGRRYPHLIEVCWVMMRLSCGCNRKITHHTRNLFRETSFVGLSPPRTPQHAPNSPPTCTQQPPNMHPTCTNTNQQPNKDINKQKFKMCKNPR